MVAGNTGAGGTGNTMGRRGVAYVVTLALAVQLGLSACGETTRKQPAAASTNGPSASAAPSASASAAPLSLAITPGTGTGGLPISSEIGTKVTGGKVTEVNLVDAAGKRIDGALRDDGTSFVPAAPLAWSTGYTATVTATGDDGKKVSQTSRFTTMGKPGGSRVGSGLYMFTGRTYGVAMPVAVEFESDVPAEARAAVQARLFVKSEPPQEGAWHWFGARQVLYRPKNFWQPGTKLTVRSALSGLPIGKRFGDTDRSATATIAGRKLVLEVDNATKQLNVFVDEQLVRTMPVSLGKPSTPSSSGTMVIMSKEESTVFDTTAEDGANGYRINIAYAQRLTWKGQFIHAAPWSVDSQGKRNVSHGCVNVSTGNASWLFGQTLVGDPITVLGTERGLDPGDGWTAWNMTWDQFLAS
jgi:lipoprotein-anchoring transpeptidase ErfK/SrfK